MLHYNTPWGGCPIEVQKSPSINKPGAIGGEGETPIHKSRYRRLLLPQHAMIGLAVVVADAAMLDTVIELDVRGDDARAAPGAPAGGRGGGVYMEAAPGQREVEGRGGAFWYEAPH